MPFSDVHENILEVGFGLAKLHYAVAEVDQEIQHFKGVVLSPFHFEMHFVSGWSRLADMWELHQVAHQTILKFHHAHGVGALGCLFPHHRINFARFENTALLDNDHAMADFRELSENMRADKYRLALVSQQHE